MTSSTTWSTKVSLTWIELTASIAATISSVEPFRELVGRWSAQGVQGVAIHAVASLANPVAIRGYFREILNFDGNVPLKSVKVPVEMVVTDRIWPEKATWGATAKQMGWDDSTRVSPRRITNAGYLVMQDQPDTLAGVVADFVARAMAAKK